MENKLHADCHENSIYRVVISFIKTLKLHCIKLNHGLILFALGCSRGFYGYNCNSTCGMHCTINTKDNSTCDPRSGDCPSVFFLSMHYGSSP